MSLDHWGWWILASTAAVVFGLVIEYWEPVREFIEEWRRPAAAFPWRKFRGLTGGILVTVGVAGEFGFTYKAFRVETNLRDNNHKIEESLNISAKSAADAAARAEASAKVIGDQAARLQATVERLIWQGPRDILLFDKSKSFELLRRFAGQKYRLSICRPDFNIAQMQDAGATEVGRTGQAISELLSPTGWKVIPGVKGLPLGIPAPYIEENCNSFGVTVNPSGSAASATTEAAAALQSVLNTVLSQERAGTVGTRTLGGGTDPGPEVLDVHIGVHPVKPKMPNKINPAR